MRNYKEQLKKHCFEQLNLSEEDIAFLRMCVKEETTPEILGEYYKSIDFEKLGGQHVCALAELSRKMQYQGVPRSLIPRVRGVIRYHTARNARQLQVFYEVLKLANENGINIMLMKGGAMKAFYMQKAIRYMGDIDFWVRQEDVNKLYEMIVATGNYQCYMYAHHAVVIKDEQILEIHGSFLKENQLKDNEQNFWQDAKQITLQGENVYVPSPEALLFLILVHIFEDSLMGNVYRSRWMRWGVDAVWLIDHYDLDWKKVGSFCQKYHKQIEVKTMLSILNDIVEGKVEQSVLDMLEIGKRTEKKIPLMLHMREANARLQEYRTTQNVKFVYWGLRYHWYRHRFLGNRSLWLVDLIEFPAYFKSIWRCRTWREWWMKVYQRVRNPQHKDFTL